MALPEPDSARLMLHRVVPRHGAKKACPVCGKDLQQKSPRPAHVQELFSLFRQRRGGHGMAPASYKENVDEAQNFPDR
ncbi:hypothetical protein [Achromobacter sp. NFACC18-2]|uniref:hypothetical protein n=1 Tax=Achromobacter sp. NFACC18-2 TaxID=1564112 RepID=UPI001113E84F|nr:hypothetical protein [Achromobacter sp. NFACC18-2]